MAIAFIGIGSNLGNRVENCVRAVEEMSNFAEILATSSFYDTEPVGKEEQQDFVNCVIKIETELSPLGLLTSVNSVENTMGRKKREKWAPRVIDLDIIFYDDVEIKTDDLVIPHPRAHERRFVLEPLSEIAPNFVHPILNASVSELLSGLKDEKRVVKIGDFSTTDSQ